MEARRLPASRGIDWMRSAVNVGGRNPRAVFGAAMLFLASLYLIAVVAVLPVASRLQGRSDLSLAESLAASLPLLLVLALATPVLLAGLVHVVHEAEQGRPARAIDVFAAFRQGRAASLMGLGLVQVLINVAGVLLVVAVTGPDYLADSIRAIQGAMEGEQVAAPEPPSLLVLAFLQAVQLALNYFSAALMLLCVPLIALSRQGFVDSLRAGLRASLRNLAPNLLAGLVFVVGFIVAALMIALLAAIIGGLGALLHPVLGGLLALTIWLAFAAAVLVVLVATSYFAWQDMFGAGSAAGATAPPSHFEA